MTDMRPGAIAGGPPLSASHFSGFFLFEELCISVRNMNFQ
jgi:hypothetical protein